MDTGRKKAVILAGAAGCMWGTIGLFVYGIGKYGIESVELTTARFLVAAFLMGIYLMIFKRSCLKIHLRDLPGFLAAGLLCLLLFNVSYGIAIEKSSMSAAAVMLYTSPVFVALISRVCFREKISLRKGAAILLSVVGCAFVSGIMSGFLKYPGQAYVWGFCAAAGYASYSITAGTLLKKYHAETVLFYAFLFASCGGCFFADIQGTIMTVLKNPMAGVGLAGAAFVCNIASYLCYNLALKYAEPSRVAVTASVEPAAASLFGMIFLREKIDVFGLAGIICILGAVLVLNVSGKEVTR